jgi:predicted signal transduction protein with EAL and GGDEF domain
MPQTSLAGARVFSDRLRKRAADDLSTSVCCGLTEAQASDDARTLLARADSALYSAKAAGANRSFVHTGAHIREHRAVPLPSESLRETPEAAESDALEAEVGVVESSCNERPTRAVAH